MSTKKTDSDLYPHTKLRAVLDHSPFPVAVVDIRDEHIFFWSESAKKMFGHTPSTTGEWYELAYPDPEYRQSVIERWKPFLKIAQKSNKTVNTGEYQITCKDGSVKTCELYAQFIPGNLIVTLMDVTERLKADQELQESVDRFKRLTEQAQDMIYRMSLPKGTYEYVSPASTSITGYTPDDYYNSSLIIQKIIHPDWIDYFKAEWEKLLSGDLSPVYEYQIIDKSGNMRWLHQRNVLVKDAKGNPVAIEGIVTDITHSKQAQDDLQKNQEYLQSIFRASPIGIGVVTDQIFHKVNNQILEMTGYRENELLGKSARILYASQADFEYVVSEKRRQIAQYGACSIETHWKCKNGQIIDVLLNSTPLYKDDLEKGITFSAMDITRQKQTEKALRENEEKFHLLFDNINVGLALHEMIYDDNGTPIDFIFLDVNQKYQEITRLKKQEIIGKRGTQVIPGLEQKWIDLYGQVALTGKSVSLIDHSDYMNKYWDVRAFSPLKNQFATVLSDITDRIHTEKEIIKTKETIERYLQMAASMFVSLGTDGTILLINQKGQDILEYSSEELVGENWIEKCVPPAIRDEIQKVFNQIIKGDIKAVEHYENTVITKSGKIKTVSWYNSYLHDESGKIINVLSSGIDITEQKMAEREKELLQQQLLQSQKLEAIGQLTGGVAHDFNNLLTIIIGNAQLMEMDMTMDHPFCNQIKSISEASERAAKLTRQLLLFSRKEAMLFKPVDLNAVINNFCKLLERLIGENIKINIELAKKLWRVRGDEGNLEQVLMNLAVNARDAMPNGGTFTLATKNCNHSEIKAEKICKSISGKYICLKIEDTGIGMTKDVVKKIFEPFYSTKKFGQGTGMGLSVVYGIIKKHNGWIIIESEPEKGSCFEIYLPALENHIETQLRKEQKWKNLKGKHERILLIEDEPGVRKFGKHILQKNDYRVDAVGSASQALELFQNAQGEYDLIISDVVLPDIDGVQLIEKLQGIKSVPVIMASGYTQERSQRAIIEEKNLPFIQKPFSIEKMLSTVQQVLESNNTSNKQLD